MLRLNLFCFNCFCCPLFCLFLHLTLFFPFCSLFFFYFFDFFRWGSIIKGVNIRSRNDGWGRRRWLHARGQDKQGVVVMGQRSTQLMRTQVYLLRLVARWGFLFAPTLPHPRPSLSPVGWTISGISLSQCQLGQHLTFIAFPLPTKGETNVEVMKSRSNRSYLTWCAFAWGANAIRSTRNQSMLDMIDIK